MTCKELLEYLSRFDPDEHVGILIVDVSKRLHHITAGYELLAELPAILLETEQSEPLDQVMEEAMDEKCQ